MILQLDSGLYIRGQFDSRFMFPGMTVTKDRPVRVFEIELFSENCGITYVDQTPYALHAGTVICAKPGCVRHSELPLITEYLKIREGMPEIDRILSEIPICFTTDRIEDGLSLLRKIRENDDQDDGIFRHTAFLDFLAWLQKEADYARESEHPLFSKTKTEIAVGETIQYMETHFCEKCTLSMLAQKAHLSPVYYHKVFKFVTGKTPNDYLTFLRIEEAKKLVLKKDYTMTEIAAQCGFSSQSYFNYAFRRATGMSPLEYCHKTFALYSADEPDFHS